MDVCVNMGSNTAAHLNIYNSDCRGEIDRRYSVFRLRFLSHGVNYVLTCQMRKVTSQFRVGINHRNGIEMHHIREINYIPDNPVIKLRYTRTETLGT